ncbi:hypothetical protein SLE2022_205990 [Rubroshorea leprosula]
MKATDFCSSLIKSLHPPPAISIWRCFPFCPPPVSSYGDPNFRQEQTVHHVERGTLQLHASQRQKHALSTSPNFFAAQRVFLSAGMGSILGRICSRVMMNQGKLDGEDWRSPGF